MTWKRSVEQPTDQSVRICTKCRLTKPVVDFGFARPNSQNHHTYNGVRMPCKACCNAAVKARDPKLRNKALRAWRAKKQKDPANANRLRAARRDWYERHRERERAKMRARYAAMSLERCEERAAYGKAKYEGNKAEQLAAQRARRATPDGREAHNARNRKHKVTEKGRETARLSTQRRRARLHDAGDISRAEWRALLTRADHRCLYCERQGRMTMDHVVPVCKGGRHDTTNVIPACRKCNVAKNSLDIAVALRKLGVAPEAFEKRWRHVRNQD
jgi:hypothetical protein